jgi:hypothetical protein
MPGIRLTETVRDCRLELSTKEQGSSIGVWRILMSKKKILRLKRAKKRAALSAAPLWLHSELNSAIKS